MGRPAAAAEAPARQPLKAINNNKPHHRPMSKPHAQHGQQQQQQQGEPAPLQEATVEATGAIVSVPCLCGHGPCALKTGTSAGPNRGRHFLVCAADLAGRPRCASAVRVRDADPGVCARHGLPISLQVMKGGVRLARCKGHQRGTWCRSTLCQGAEAEGEPGEGAAGGSGGVDELCDGLASLTLPHTNEAAAPTTAPPPEPPRDTTLLSSFPHELGKQRALLQASLRNGAAHFRDGGAKLRARLADIGLALAFLHHRATAPPQPAPAPAPAREEVRVAPPRLVEEDPALVALAQQHRGRKGTGATNTTSTSTSSAKALGAGGETALAECAGWLHSELAEHPGFQALADQPTAVTTALMPHQRHALAWMQWREAKARRSVRGGFNADDMGLGKTLSMLALCCPTPAAGQTATLVVCPAPLLWQWKGQVEQHVAEGTFDVRLFHGRDRAQQLEGLSHRSLVITSYEVLAAEFKDREAATAPTTTPAPATAAPGVFGFTWGRVVLDEGHVVKKRSTLRSRACCALAARRRWVVTGTPVQNSLGEMYSLMLFLRCHPFADHELWKREVGNDLQQGHARLKGVLNCLMLRRTKAQRRDDGQPIVHLPEREELLHRIKLSAPERQAYRHLRDTLHKAMRGRRRPGQPGGKQREPGARAAQPAVTTLSALIWLRLFCVHPPLANRALAGGATDGGDGVDGLADLLAGSLSLGGHSDGGETAGLRLGTKMRACLDLLAEVRRRGNGREKAIIVSQWVRVLDVVEEALADAGVWSVRFDGTRSHSQRRDALRVFDKDPACGVLLLSLEAGGTGLNLTAANHLFLLDMHYNPAVEQQAADRVYRVGQSRPVFIHRFVCEDTVEQRLLRIQAQKRRLADRVIFEEQSAKLTPKEAAYLFS